MSAVEGNEMDGYEALISELRANPPVAPERLRQRVLEGAPAPRRQRSRKRKLVLVLVPVAAVLAVGGAFVHGFLNSGSNPATAAPADNHTIARVTGHGSATTGSGKVFFGRDTTATTPEAAIQSKSKSLYGPAASSTWNSASSYSLKQSGADVLASGSTPLALRGAPQGVTIPRNRLVHAVASLQVGVKSKELSAKTNEASQIVGSFGGYAQSIRYQSTRQGDGEAILALKVPVQNAQKAITRLDGLGTTLSQQISTQDLQAKVTHQTSAIGSLRRAIAVYEAALSSTTEPAQRAELQIKLNNARRALARLRHARAGTVAQAATAEISLLLTTNGHAIVAPGHHGSSRIGRLLGSAAHFLALEGIIVLYAIIVLAPLLLIAALVWWILRERRRREERLLSTA